MDELQLNHQDGELVIKGDLTRHKIAQFDKKFINKLLAKSLTIDLAQTIKVDTAGLAWLLMVVEIAATKACQLHFVNLSDDVIKLAKLCGVEELFVSSN